MTVSVIICDDSNMARKQLARCLPKEWEVSIDFAENGLQALDLMHDGLGDILFLDLTMPELDGFGTLAEIKKQCITVDVIVVSGDIQDEARRRVMELGALDFIRKPSTPDQIEKVLLDHKLYKLAPKAALNVSKNPEESKSSTVKTAKKDSLSLADQAEIFDCYQEITNVAMGRAGDLLARLTGEFVSLPIPKVAMLEASELLMALAFADDDSVSAVCQGFISRGIAGEALLLFSDSSFANMAELMKQPGESESVQIEVLTDLSGALLGAILNGLGEQLDLSFSQGYPTVLGRHSSISNLISANTGKWTKTLTIEVTYVIESHDIICDVLLLFTAESMASINSRLSYVLSDE